MKIKGNLLKLLIIIIATIVVAALILWWVLRDTGPGDGFVMGNGRLEATEIDISTKLAGRIAQILVEEGDFVEEGQLLVIIQSDTLEAQLRETQAQHQQAIASKSSAEAQLRLRQSEREAAEATVAQRKSELDAAQRKLKRSAALVKDRAISRQEYDDDETRVHGARAAVAAARAQVAVSDAAMETARSDIIGAEATIKAAEATIARIEADINDCSLLAPRGGRIQFKISQKGEVLGVGGKVLNLVDLSDVYMTFFLPEVAAGKVALGSEVRIILDTAPDMVIPARISFVASVAQFTPKTVETESERQKLMFRVKARLDPAMLQKYITQVKTGLPGVAWLKLDDNIDWPESLQVTPALMTSWNN